MDITCDKCQKIIVIPDDKIPAGKKASLLCPKCKTRLTVVAPESNAALDFSAGSFSFDESGEEEKEAPKDEPAEDSEEEALDSPFDFTEETQKTALICNLDQETTKPLKKALTLLEYQVETADSTRDSLKKLRYHSFDLIVVTDPYDTAESAGVMTYLENLPMEVRRDMFIILYCTRYKSSDHMKALSLSVNQILSSVNLGKAASVISRAVTENDMFYRVFKDIQGKIYDYS